MTNERIYKLAFSQLLMKKEFEENHLQAYPNNSITKHNLEVIENEINELKELILKEEHK